MTDILSAQQARDLMPDRQVEAWIGKIGETIRYAAMMGETSVRLPYDLTEISGQGGVSPKGKVGEIVVERLRTLGYEVRSHWVEAQFVDAYFTVEWPDQ